MRQKHELQVIRMRMAQYVRICEHLRELRARGMGALADQLLNDLERIEMVHFPTASRSKAIKRRLEERGALEASQS